MTRYRASGIHLLISAGVAVLFIALVLFLWYPQPYFKAGGGQTLLTLLITIDVILGPVITLIIFKSGKKGLKFDLSVIALLQIAALSYGALAILAARPVYVTYSIDRFVLVSANDISEKALEEARDTDYATLSWTGPRLVAAVLPTDPQVLSELTLATLSGQPDIDIQPKYYRDYSSQTEAVKRAAKPLRKITQGTAIPADISDYLEANGLAQKQVAWLPLVSRTGSLVMLLRSDNAKPLKAFAHDPWK